MKNKTIKRILGFGLSTGLVFASLATIFAAPAPVAAGSLEWGTVDTPSWADLVITPGTNIFDYAIGGDGDTIYAVLASDVDCNGVGDVTNSMPIALVKSTDGGVTWSDITDNLQGADNLPTMFTWLIGVAVAPDDEDWVAVVGYDADGGDPSPVSVVASQDGGDNFSYTGDMEDVGFGSVFDVIFDIAVSPEISDIHNIAVAGMTDWSVDPLSNDGVIYRLKAGSWLSAAWEDTRAYDGWDLPTSDAVIACGFSGMFEDDDTIVFMTVDDSAPSPWNEGEAYLQAGIWEGGGGAYNSAAGFPDPVQLSADGDTLWTGAEIRSMGFALPDDYDGSDPGARAVYVYVNAFNTVTMLTGGFLMRVDNGAVSEPYGPSGNPLLFSIDFHGDADTGKMMIGEYIQWDNDAGTNGIYGDYIIPGPCEGVRVWHTVELDPCCPNWELACKSPSGLIAALVMYTPDGEKAYASTTGYVTDGPVPLSDGIGTALDESAFSVSLDDGVSFNQIGLIDTDIDYLADVAICPDCSTIYLATFQEEIDIGIGDYPCLGDALYATGVFNCDSVWRSYDDGDTWERILHGDWVDYGGWEGDELLLRLPCDAVEDCCDQDPVSPSGTLYLGIKNYANDSTPWDDESLDQILYSRDCGQCWNSPPATKIDIQDFAVESENIVYVLDVNGDFSMSTQYGRRWSDAVNTGMDSGHSITSCCDEGFVVAGGFDGDPVAWSDDGGESWNTTDDVPIDGQVHVACDPVCPNIVYAAVDGRDNAGSIYRTDLTDGGWDNLTPVNTDYTGIVVANEGTLYAATDFLVSHPDPEGGVCNPYRFQDADYGNNGGMIVTSGVARNLDPCETACCGDESWDYLVCGLNPEDYHAEEPYEDFDNQPTSLRICGCLSTDTNSVLWAIDTDYYDVENGSGSDPDYGQLWSYED
ncbi:hypothetical protein ACFLTJ_03540, partial [Chloroflexota bacterium]